MRDILKVFVDGIKEICGENLNSVILYGSRASGEATEKYSDYNLLIVLEEDRFHDLKLFAGPVRKWIKHGNPAPLIFTMSRFKKSFDVFPIEFLEMKEHHKILYGNDPLEGLNIEQGNLRHEVEFELKGKLLKMRQGFIMTSCNQNKIRELLINSISIFLVLFRQVIRLTGEVPPAKRIDSLKRISELAGINTSPFVSVIKMKENAKESKGIVPETVFEEYIKEIEKAIDFVDNLGVN